MGSFLGTSCIAVHLYYERVVLEKIGTDVLLMLGEHHLIYSLVLTTFIRSLKEISCRLAEISRWIISELVLK